MKKEDLIEILDEILMLCFFAGCSIGFAFLVWKNFCYRGVFLLILDLVGIFVVFSFFSFFIWVAMIGLRHKLSLLPRLKKEIS